MLQQFVYELARGLPVESTRMSFSELTSEQRDSYDYIASQDAALGYFHAIQTKFLDENNTLKYKVQLKWDKQTRLYVSVTRNITVSYPKCSTIQFTNNDLCQGFPNWGSRDEF